MAASVKNGAAKAVKFLRHRSSTGSTFVLDDRGTKILDGYLVKHESYNTKLNKFTTKKCWFVLYSNNILAWYEDPTAPVNFKSPIGDVSLYMVIELRLLDKQQQFLLITSSRTYILRCNSSDEYKQWIKTLGVRIIPNEIHRGWLFKKGEQNKLAMKKWRKRMFILCEYDNNYEIRYYENESLKKYKGRIKCKDIKKINKIVSQTSKVNKYGKDFVFELITSYRVYVLAAKDEYTRNLWNTKLKPVLSPTSVHNQNDNDNDIKYNSDDDQESSSIDLWFTDVQDHPPTPNGSNDHNNQPTDPKSRVAYYWHLAKQNPDDIEINLRLASSYHHINQVDEAEKQYIQCLCIEPFHVQTIKCLLQLYREKKEYSIAQNYSQQLVKRFPKNAEFNAEYAVIMYRLKQFDIAIKYAKIASDLEPTSKYDRLYLYCLMELEQWGKAIEICRQLLQINKCVVLIKYYLRISQHMGTYHDGRIFFNNLEDRYKTDPSIINCFGQLLMYNKQYEMALKQFNECTRLQPNNNEYRNNAAIAWKRLKQQTTPGDFIDGNTATGMTDDDDDDPDDNTTNGSYLDDVEGLLTDRKDVYKYNDKDKSVKNLMNSPIKLPLIEEKQQVINVNDNNLALNGSGNISVPAFQQQDNSNSKNVINLKFVNKITEENKIKLWLEEMDLLHYFDIFKDNGFDKMDDMKDITENDLKTIGIKLLGHRKRILKSVHAMNNKKKSVVEEQEGTKLTQDTAYM